MGGVVVTAQYQAPRQGAMVLRWQGALTGADLPREKPPGYAFVALHSLSASSRSTWLG
jgi:hypothetical protein